MAGCAWIALLLSLAGCRPTQLAVDTQPTPPALRLTGVDGDARAAAVRLIALERTASGSGDEATLAALWTENARIVDGRNSAEVHDDYQWVGRAAILDRYRVAVFPAPPPPFATPPTPTLLQTDGEHALLTNGGDRWRLEWSAGRWWLAELVYQQP